MVLSVSLSRQLHTPARRRSALIVFSPDRFRPLTTPDDARSRRQEAGKRSDERWSALMVEAQAGDGAAYNVLLREIVPLIQRIARRQGVEGDRVDDVVQEVLSSIHRARHTYDPTRSFTAWTTTISQRRAIDVLRRNSRHIKRERHAPLAYEAYAEPGREPDRPRDEADRAKVLGDAIAGLSEGQREAVEHLAIRELTLAETARLTGKSKGALKVNLHRAMKTLRARLGGKL